MSSGLQSEKMHKPNHRNDLEFHEVILGLMVLLVCTVFLGYGAFLRYVGVDTNANNINSNSITSLIALGVTSLEDGVYPWNYQEDIITPDADKRQIKREYSDTLAMYTDIEKDGVVSSRVPVGRYGSRHTREFMGTVDARIADLQAVSSMEITKVSDDQSDNLSSEVILNTEPLDFTAVDDTYFDDAVFIGDSRTVGICEYAGINNATFLGKTAMTIFSLMDTQAETDAEHRTVREVLESESFGKVYIMVGINELGTGDTAYFVNKYSQVIDEIRELQPEAIIFVQAIMHVSHDMDLAGSYINNATINERNQGISELANGANIFYIDVNPVFDDEYGALVKAYTWDDVHLYATHYMTWHAFYLEHGIVLP